MISEFGKNLLILGFFIFVLGLIMSAFDKIPFLGKLPGDILVRKDGFNFYFPLTTSIILSILFSLLLRIFNK